MAHNNDPPDAEDAPPVPRRLRRTLPPTATEKAEATRRAAEAIAARLKAEEDAKGPKPPLQPPVPDPGNATGIYPRGTFPLSGGGDDLVVDEGLPDGSWARKGPGSNKQINDIPRAAGPAEPNTRSAPKRRKNEGGPMSQTPDPNDPQVVEPETIEEEGEETPATGRGGMRGLLMAAGIVAVGAMTCMGVLGGGVAAFGQLPSFPGLASNAEDPNSEAGGGGGNGGGAVTQADADWLDCDPRAPTTNGARIFTDLPAQTFLGKEVFAVVGLKGKRTCVRRDGDGWQIVDNAVPADDGRCIVGDAVDKSLRVRTLCIDDAGKLVAAQHITASVSTKFHKVDGHPGVEARCCPGNTDQACQMEKVASR